MEIKNYNKYPEYKKIEEKWVDEIPEHWNVQSLKSILAERNEKNNPIKTKEILSLSMHRGVTKYSDKGRGGNKAKNDLTAYKVARPNDIVLNSMNVIVGSVGLSKYFGAISPVYYALYARTQEINIYYYNYVFQNPSFQMSLFPLGNGILIKKSEASDKLNTIRLRIPMNKLNKVLLPLPPLQEQEAIAKFLDEKCEKIDLAVKQKEKLIELLKERKQVIIQNAVTKGIDSNVPMKDSGVEWIGETPEHWNVDRFKYLFSQSRLPVKKQDKVVTSYRDGQVTLRENRRLTGYTEAIIEGGYQGIRVGQLVLNSMDAFEGAIGVSDSNGKCTPEYVICDPKVKDIIPKYFAYLLREMALAKYIPVICNAVRQRAIRIRYNNLASRFMVIPPKKEQLEIISYIENIKNETDQTIKVFEQQIQRLKEYKEVLIDDAVTGKIKVTE